jgi:hypothetical protein
MYVCMYVCLYVCMYVCVHIHYPFGSSYSSVSVILVYTLLLSSYTPTDTAMEQVLLERSGVGQPDAPERANSAFGVREEDWQRCLIALESLT